MLVAHLSDLHVAAGGTREGNVGRIEQAVGRVLGMAAAPDVVLVSGDLTDDGEPASYRILRDLLAPLGSRVLLAMGNHDRRAPFLQAFPETPTADGFVQYAAEFDERRIVVLDTLEEGCDNGAFCDARAHWLDATLATRPETATVVAMHHPPAPIGIDWMDVRPDDAWTDRLAQVIRRHRQVVALAAGHVHRPTTTVWEGRLLATASSVAPQVALDLAPIDPLLPDGRPLIIAEPPGLALHRWDGGGLTTHFDAAAAGEVVVAYDERHRSMIRDMMRVAPRPGHAC